MDKHTLQHGTPQHDDIPQLISVFEAGLLLGTSTDAVRKKIIRNQLPADVYRIDGRVLVDGDQLASYIRSCKLGPDAHPFGSRKDMEV